MPHTIFRESFARRVKRGIKLLDRQFPDWRTKIDLDTLDITSSCNCVLGQVFGSYAFGCENFHFTEYNNNCGFRNPAWYGFSTWIYTLKGFGKESAAVRKLESEWRRQLSPNNSTKDLA